MKPNRRLTRREFLALGALSASACWGAGLVGSLAGVLFARRAYGSNPNHTRMDATQMVNSPQTANSVQSIKLVDPLILPREAWNARSVNHDATHERGFASTENPYGWYQYPDDLAKIYRTVAIHHSYPFLRDSGTMRQIQDLHMDQDQWADIGYHYGIDGKGATYAGRDVHVRGASVAGHNTGTVGVVLIGDFQHESPSDLQIVALQMLANWLKATYGITHLAGHYEFNPETVCPGSNMRPYLDVVAQQAGLQRGTGGYVAPTNGAAAKNCCGSQSVT